MDEDRHQDDLVSRLRAEVADWRRRAEMAEAIASERLARAQSAERALDAAEAALQRLAPAAGAGGPVDAPVSPAAPEPGAPEPAQPPPPRSWLERWRRYTDSIT